MISLNYRDPRPIYEQIVDSVRRLVISGAMSPDDKLPSVRELAAQLAINPNTIARSYRELEAEGWIYSISGRGSYIAQRGEVGDSRRQELLKQFDATSREILFLGVTMDELVIRLSRLVNERIPDENVKQAQGGESND